MILMLLSFRFVQRIWGRTKIKGKAKTTNNCEVFLGIFFLIQFKIKL